MLPGAALISLDSLSVWIQTAAVRVAVLDIGMAATRQLALTAGRGRQEQKRSRCFWGLAGSGCCLFYGGVEPEVRLWMYRREATRGSRGERSGMARRGEWVVTMLVAGRDYCFWGVGCGIIARPGLFFPIEGCREDSSEVESVHKNQAHLFASIRPSVK